MRLAAASSAIQSVNWSWRIAVGATCCFTRIQHARFIFRFGDVWILLAKIIALSRVGIGVDGAHGSSHGVVSLFVMSAGGVTGGQTFSYLASAYATTVSATRAMLLRRRAGMRASATPMRIRRLEKIPIHLNTRNRPLKNLPVSLQEAPCHTT